MRTPITDISQLDLNATYTVADYLSWQFDELVQLIRGKVVRMSPAPRTSHAQLSSKLQRALYTRIAASSPCQVFDAPFDVYLVGKDSQRPTIVQPDILIVCDAAKLDERGYQGPPDWVCEIVSPGSFKLDTVTKKQLYAEAGVPEYTILHPGDKVVEVYRLGPDGHYGEPEVLGLHGQSWELSSVPGVSITYNELFGEPDYTV